MIGLRIDEEGIAWLRLERLGSHDLSGRIDAHPGSPR